MSEKDKLDKIQELENKYLFPAAKTQAEQIVSEILKIYNKREANMPKVTVSKTAQNELIKIMSTKQNAKSKLNAGSLREAAKITLESILELSPKAKAELAAALVKSV